MTDTLTRIVFPLSALTPLKTYHTACYTHSYDEERIFGTQGGRAWTNLQTRRTDFSLRLDKISCNLQDVAATEDFLRDLIAQKPRTGTLELNVAKPAFTMSETRLMGVSEHGRRAVIFPPTERVAFTLIAPPSYWGAAKALLVSLAPKVPSDASPAVRNLMASAYLTHWKKRKGNWLNTKPVFLEQNGLIDFQVRCIISFDPTLAKLFTTAVSLPPHGSVQRTIVS